MTALVWLAAMAVACDGAVDSGRTTTGRGGDPSPPPGDDAPPDPGDPDVPDASDGGTQRPPPADAPSCAEGPASAVTSQPLDVTGASSDGAVVAAAREGGGAVVAWTSSAGIQLVDVDASGATSSPVSIDGNDPWGIAASGTHRGLLVDRGSDTLALVLIDDAGAATVDRALIGRGGSGGGAWGPYIRAARLAWTGERWIAYFTLTEGGHYGDRLLYFGATGEPLDGGWDWGCSHSMDVRIAVHGGSDSAVCISDCYPEKGMLLDRRTMLHPDPTGDCSGGTSSSLGGTAVLPGGAVWAGLETSYDRSSTDVGVVRIDGGGGGVRFLTDDATDDEHLHIGPWGSGLAAGWVTGGTSVMAAVDATGALVGEPQPVPGASFATASDMFVHADGSLGWAQIRGGGVEVFHLAACGD